MADYETAPASVAMRLAAAESLLTRSEQLRQEHLSLAAEAVKHSGGGLFVIAVGVGATCAGERVALGPTVVVGVRVPLPVL